MKRATIGSVVAIALLACGSVQSQVTENAYVLENISAPFFAPDSVFLNCGGEVVFNLRVRITPEVGLLQGYCIPFHIYSPDGATWQPGLTGTVTPDFSASGGNFNVASINTFSPDGMGADTIRFSGVALGGGLPVPPGGYDEVAWTIRFALNPGSANDGLTICIDSSATAPPTCTWEWASDAGDIGPTFTGPHCFTLVYLPLWNCGNVNCDPGLNIDLSDLIYLVDNLFLGGPAPIIAGWADMNCDSEVDLSDLIYLVNYLFLNGPAPCSEC